MKQLTLFPSNRKQILLLILIIGILTLSGGYLLVLQYRQSAHENIRQELQLVSQIKANELSAWFLDELHDAQILASNKLIAEEVVVWLNTKDIVVERRIKDFLKSTREVHGLSDVGIGTLEKSIVLSANDDFSCLDQSLIQTIEKAIESREAVSTDIYECKIHGSIMIDFIAPILDPGQRVVAVMIFRCDPSISIFSRFINLPLQRSTQESYLVKKQNDSLKYLSPLKYAESPVLERRKAVCEDNGIGKFIMMGEVGSHIGLDYRNEKVFSYIVPVSSTPWYLVTELDMKEVRSNIFLSHWVQFALIIAVLLFAILGIMLIYFYRQRSAYKALYNKEKELYVRQEEYRLIAEKSAESIWIADLNMQFTYVSPSVFRLRGVSVETAMKQQLSDFLTPESYARTMQAFQEELAREASGDVDPDRSIYLELEEYLPDGSTVWIANTISILRDENGKANGILGISRDVTEKHQTINALKDAMKKAEESDRLKTAFLNNMSHEIRTPLNGMLGFLDLIDDTDLDEEERHSFIQIIQQNSQQLLSVIDDIIQIATIESGQEQVRDTYTNINLTLENLEQQYIHKSIPEVLSIKFTSLVDPDMAMVITDKTKLVQVIANLMNNAIKFTEKGLITCECKIEEGFLHFSVCDTGIGIPEEFHEVIFSRFRQVDETQTRQYGGNGLGLAISKAYVSLLGGEFCLESAPGKGSCFSFTIPYRPVPGIPIEAGKSDIDGHLLEGITILVAEDEDSNYELLEIILGRYNVKLIQAEDGREAVKACRHNPDIKIVLMDIKMPIMNGYDASREIKSFKPGLPIIALTAHALHGSRQEALEAGCDDYLAKPVRKQDLLDMICKYLS